MKVTEHQAEVIRICALGRDTLMSRLTDANMIHLMNTVYTAEKFLDAKNWTVEEYAEYSKICDHAIDNMI